MEELISKIMLKAYQITQKGKYQIFLRFDAHVNLFEVYFYNDGIWYSNLGEGNICHKLAYAYLNEVDAMKQLKECLKKLEELEEK